MIIIDERKNSPRWKMKQVFRDYNNSNEWKELIKKVEIRDSRKCKDCLEHKDNSKRKFHVHHTSYDNWGFGDFREEEDLVLLCEICHYNRHLNKSVIVPFWAKINSSAFSGKS